MLNKAASFYSRCWRAFPLSKALVGGLLSLSLGMVGTDISQVTTGALGAKKGVVGGQQKTGDVERFEDLVFTEVWCDGFWKISCLGGSRCCYVSSVGHWPTLVEL